jgi:predicted ester cyclase
MNNSIEENKITATRFIEAFNTDDWDTVREVVAKNYVFHHPVGGTVQAGPEGMVAVWSDFKASLPDSWHPIPIMIAEGDYLAVLLPTYGNFTGKPYHGAAPTGKWLEYGMVNIVRFEKGKLAENWFGMDPVVERQQMGAAPSFPLRKLNRTERRNISLFQKTINTEGLEFDNITAFGDKVIALGPPQYEKSTTTRKIEIYHELKNSLELAYYHEFITNPPYLGDSAVDNASSRNVVKKFFNEVLYRHNLNLLSQIASSNILVHPTAMPCEASFFGIDGVANWLGAQWRSFPDLTVTGSVIVTSGDIVAVHWIAQGTSKGKFLFLRPTGKEIKYTGSSMYRIEDGKIAEIWEARNTMDIMKQVNPKIGSGQHKH